MKSRKRAAAETAPPVPDPYGPAQSVGVNQRETTPLSHPLTREQQMDACEEQIRQLAYGKWEQAGCPSGDGFDFWIEAEREVMNRPQTL